MTNHRYKQLLMPIDRYVRRLTPRGRTLFAMAEGGLFLILLASVFIYVQ